MMAAPSADHSIQTPAGGPAAPPSYSLLILAALFYIQAVNFIDKAVVGVAAPAIMRDLSLSAADYGWVASSFYALYAVSGLAIAATLGHRVPPRHILTGLLLVWTIAQLPAMVATSVSFLVVSRLILGAGEGAGTPTAVNCCYEWFPPSGRSIPTAILFFGNTVGKIVAAPLLTYVIASYSWQAAFGVCAALGGMGAIMWIVVGRTGPWAAPASEPSERRNVLFEKSVWTNRSILAMCAVCFCSYWITGFSVSWLAPYLQLSVGFDAKSAGWVMAGIYAGQSALMFLIASASDRMTRSGVSPRVVQSLLMGLCLVMSAAAFLACGLVQQKWANALLFMIGSAMPVAVLTLAPGIIASLVPDWMRNQVVGLVLAGVTVSGILAPVTTGLLVDHGNGSFRSAFILVAAISFIGAIAACFVDSQRKVEGRGPNTSSSHEPGSSS